jgi:hypothetical protein
VTPRCGRRLKWASAFATGAIGVAWLLTGWYTTAVWYVPRPPKLDCPFLLLGNGAASLGSHTLDGPPPGLLFVPVEPLFGPNRPHWLWMPRIHRATDDFSIVTPLWIVFLVVAAPAAWLWRRDKRLPPGCCPGCGYNLLGIASGVCPECGVNQNAV